MIHPQQKMTLLIKMNRHFGKFEISTDYLNKHLDIISHFFKETSMVIVGVTNDYATGILEYTGISPYFDEVPESEQIPKYLINFVANNSDTTLVTSITSILIEREDTKKYQRVPMSPEGYPARRLLVIRKDNNGNRKRNANS